MAVGALNDLRGSHGGLKAAKHLGKAAMKKLSPEAAELPIIGVLFVSWIVQRR